MKLFHGQKHVLIEPNKEYPIVYHNNGQAFSSNNNRGYVYWGLIEKYFFKDRSVYRKFKKPHGLDIILCHNSKKKSIAQKCLERLGIFDYIVLGQDVARWNYFNKIQIILDFLLNYSKADYILYLDAFDVIICDDPNFILSRFTSEFHCDVLFSAEKHSYPGSHMKYILKCRSIPWYKYIFAYLNNYALLSTFDLEKIKRIERFEKSKYNSIFKHLNSGCYIGRRKSLIKLFKEALTLKRFFMTGVLIENDDQAVIRELHRKFYPWVMIDHQCRIFQSMFLIHRNEVISKYQITNLDINLSYLKYGIKMLNGVIQARIDTVRPYLSNLIELISLQIGKFLKKILNIIKERKDKVF